MDRDEQSGEGRVAQFAGILAALAAQGPRQSREHGGELGLQQSDSQGFESLFDGLEDDVATLSYARALELRSRNNATGPAPSAADGGPAAARDEASGAETRPPTSSSESPASRQAGDGLDTSAGLKRASVTLRMSQAECARLRQLAAEAGLTVSAYLRFCAFEVESLRGQVKAALADMRPPQPSAPVRRSRWLRLIHPSG